MKKKRLWMIFIIVVLFNLFLCTSCGTLKSNNNIEIASRSVDFSTNKISNSKANSIDDSIDNTKPINKTTVKYVKKKNPYKIFVSTVIPESLYLCKNNSVVFSTYVNTGISAAPTPCGEFNIYLKMTRDTMKGIEPNGKEYYDPNVPWVMYFYNGDAIHGFSRSRYGFPQSLGCVELPINKAKELYDLVPVGTPVVITNSSKII